MQFIDEATIQLILFSFTIILMVFLMTFIFEVIINFLRLIFGIKKNENNDSKKY